MTLFAFKSSYKNVRPGFVQVESDSSEPEVFVTAFKQGDSLTSVLINVGDARHSVELDVTGGTMPASFDVHRGSEAEGGYVDIGTVTNNAFDLPAKSFTTLVHVGDASGGSGGSAGSWGSAVGAGGGGAAAGGTGGGAPGTGRTGGSAASGNAGTSGTGAGSPSAEPDAEEADGCACLTAGGAGGGGGWMVAALAGITLLLRRR